jgi:serine protease
LRYYGGTGTPKVGVQVHPKVYVVFWGTQWGTPSTAGGDVTFPASGDPANAAPYVQDFLRGLYGGSDTWSTSTTQYCQGIAKGSTTCPATSTFVQHPVTTPLAGVWADQAASAPVQATAQQIGQEADRAAQHFGNLTPSSNSSVQYVIVSPTQTHPDGFNLPTTGWCAWHDFTQAKDIAVKTARGNVAFTNLPYITDATVNCGMGFVNTPGLLDGWSIVEGHEYAETVTDIFPQAPVGATNLSTGGWFEPVGGENGDKCAWISPGSPGGAANISLATGQFPVQSLWSNNDAQRVGGCVIYYASATNQH